MINPSLIRKLPNNTNGKDYVIGDLHGCFDLLEQLLEFVCFDTSCDRLFSVGDLIDRGPDSLRCLGLLTEPWFYAVQGNHELMMLDFFAPYLTSGTVKTLEDVSEIGFLVNGGDWIDAYFQPQLECMSDEFNRSLNSVLEIPLILVVGDGDSRFNVVHAELTKPGYQLYKQPVWLDSDLDRWINEEEMDANTQDRILWGRKLMRSKDYPAVQQGLSTTFCGHTIANHPRRVLSHLCIDTGAFISLESYYAESTEYGLTLFDVQEERWFQSSYGNSNVVASDYIQGR
jgi:serine/threonine protein phosphatase 1